MPLGIGPIAGGWAELMRKRGHSVQVVTSHPHYPSPVWGRSWRPRRRREDGVDVVRLPVPLRRDTAAKRMVQEASFTLGLLAAGPLLEKPDVIVAISPSLASLSATMTMSAARGVPWVLWLQDMVADAAHTTGLVRSHGVLHLADRLESAAFRSAAHIVVVSDAFRKKLAGMRVPDSKISTSYNPATFPILEGSRAASDGEQVINIGNIGRSQGLPRLVSAFEHSAELQRLGVRLVITGEGVTSNELRGAIRTDRVEYRGVIPHDDLIGEVDRSAIGLVSQRPGPRRVQPSIETHELHGAGSTGARVGRSWIRNREPGARVRGRLGHGPDRSRSVLRDPGQHPG